MIEFYDLSHWNTDIDALQATHDKAVALKCTEGTNYTDSEFYKRLVYYRDKPVIAYHFLRADKGRTPEAEMRNYLDALARAGRPLIMALDYEAPYCTNNKGHFEYLIKCISVLLTRTGKEPYIYINESQLTSAKRQGYNFSWVWCAKWSSKPPVHECGIWQYTNRPLDRNRFMLNDIEMLKRHEVEVR